MENKSPEICDIINRIRAYNVCNPDTTFVFGLVGYSQCEEACEDCGGECVEPDNDKSFMGAHGGIEDLRILLNSLRDMVEDEQDEEGFVSI